MVASPKEITVTATEFSRNFGRYQDRVLAGEIVKVTSHGRLVGAYLSEAALLRYQKLLRREHEVLVVGDLPDDALADIEAAQHGKEPARSSVPSPTAS